MKPEDVPGELVAKFETAAIAGSACYIGTGGAADQMEGQEDAFFRSGLAAVLPAHEAMIADAIEAHGQALMDAAVERVMSDDPGGQTAAMRAATVTYVAKILRLGGLREPAAAQIVRGDE